MRILRWSIGLALLVFQLGAIVHARTMPSRYFCWAPFDMQTAYRLKVVVNGEELTATQISARYRRPAVGTDNRSTQHLIDIIEGAERRYHPDDRTEIVMTYRVNGKQEETWQFRQP